ncbi:hypothetical protein LNM98_12310, partial [Escherichia fergusonii]|nr:hypothetical protein [Escherichia fergusonii]
AYLTLWFPLLIWWTPLCLIRQILTRRFRLYAYAHFAMNAHFLCSEALIQQPDGLLFGRWLMLQTSSFTAGGSHLNAAELNVEFRREAGVMRMHHFTTRNLFSRPVDHWHAADVLPVPDNK